MTETTAYDEAFERAATPRPHYRGLVTTLESFTLNEIDRRERLQKISLVDQGITFTVYGEKEGIERENLARLVVKTTGDSGGYNMLMGPFALRKEIEAYAAQMRKAPGNYIAQPLIELSSHPTWVDGKFEPRRIDLRPFILYGETIRVLPGGLTRVALRPGSYVVNSSQGGGSKDTWVLASRSA